jgi:hypothetical protein
MRTFRTFPSMKFCFKNSGIWVLLSGELFLIIPFLLKNETNTTLTAGLSLVITGFVMYVVINKKIRYK